MVFTRRGYKEHGVSPIHGIIVAERKGRQKKITHFFPPKEEGTKNTNEITTISPPPPILDWSVEYRCSTIEINKEDYAPDLATELAAAENVLDFSRVEKKGGTEVDDPMLKQIDELAQGGIQTEKEPFPKPVKARGESDTNTLFQWVKDILEEMTLIKIFLYESYELLTTLSKLTELQNAPNNNNK